MEVRLLVVGAVALATLTCGERGVVPAPSPATTSYLPTPSEAPVPSTANFRDVGAGQTSLWALEFTKGIIRSSGGGQWNQVGLPGGSTPAALFVSGDDRAWAVVAASGLLTVFRTVDGGHRWAAAEVGPGANYPVKLRIADGVHGVLAAGDQPGTLYATPDGGITWSPLPSPPRPPPGPCYGVSAAWVSGQSFIGSPGTCAGTSVNLYITHDSGKTWQAPAYSQPAWVPQGQTLTGARPIFLNAKDGYALAASGGGTGGAPLHDAGLMVTHDGGAHWVTNVLAQPVFAADFRQAPLIRLAMYSSSKTTGEQSWLYETRDDGKTLGKLGRLPDAVRDVAFRDPMNGVASASSQLVTTRDGGETWTPVP